MKLPNKTILGIIIAIVTSLLYGVYPAASRKAYEFGANATFMILATTFARASIMIVYCMFRHRKLFQTRTHTRDALSGGVFQALSVIGIFMALNYLPGPIVIVIVFTNTLFLLMWMAWTKEIKLDMASILTTLLTLIGLSLVLNVWDQDDKLSVIGIALAFMSALAGTIRLYVIGNQTKTRNAAVVGAEAFICAALFVFLIVFFNAPTLPTHWHGYLWSALSCGSMAGATLLMFYGIAMMGSFKFSLFAKIEPIFTALFSFIIIGQALDWLQYIGIIVVVGSLVAYHYMTEKPAKAVI